MVTHVLIPATQTAEFTVAARGDITVQLK